tara:strand:- start:279 stop:593 length:315 start_codon:yes stop_codon:yes gene_type:complete
MTRGVKNIMIEVEKTYNKCQDCDGKGYIMEMGVDNTQFDPVSCYSCNGQKYIESKNNIYTDIVSDLSSLIEKADSFEQRFINLSFKLREMMKRIKEIENAKQKI